MNDHDVSGKRMKLERTALDKPELAHLATEPFNAEM